MGRKKKIVEELFTPDVHVNTPFIEPIKEESKPTFRDFKYGTLVQDCNRCGHRQIMELGIEGGIQIMLPTTDKHHLIMECQKCKNTMMWHYIEAFEPGPRAKKVEEPTEVETKIEDEPVREESKEEQTV